MSEAGEVTAVSKVVHLSNEAHAQAKVYCKSRGLKMSDWVGSLIIDAISEQEEPLPKEQPLDVSVPRKKQLPRTDDSVQSSADGVPVYSQPPFWAKPEITPEDEEEEISAGEPQGPTLLAQESSEQTADESVSPLVGEPESRSNY